MNRTKGIQQRVGKPFFSSLCSRAAGVDDRHRCACRATAGPLPLFFFFPPANSPLLEPPEVTSWHTEQLSEGQAGRWESKKQLCSWSTATKKATKTRGKKNISHTAQYATMWICTFNSWLWQHIMPKPDFTSRPERMSSCFPHTHTDCYGGGKLWAGWQQTPP